jgi:hypothetical protein
MIRSGSKVTGLSYQYQKQIEWQSKTSAPAIENFEFATRWQE